MELPENWVGGSQFFSFFIRTQVGEDGENIPRLGKISLHPPLPGGLCPTLSFSPINHHPGGLLSTAQGAPCEAPTLAPLQLERGGGTTPSMGMRARLLIILLRGGIVGHLVGSG